MHEFQSLPEPAQTSNRSRSPRGLVSNVLVSREHVHVPSLHAFSSHWSVATQKLYTVEQKCTRALKRNLSFREQRKHINGPSHKSSGMFEDAHVHCEVQRPSQALPIKARKILAPRRAPPGSKQRGHNSAGSSPSDVHQVLQTFMSWQFSPCCSGTGLVMEPREQLKPAPVTRGSCRHALV